MLVARFFIEGLGLTLAAKNCPNQLRALKKVRNSTVGVSVRRKNAFAFFSFFERTGSRYSKAYMLKA